MEDTKKGRRLFLCFILLLLINAILSCELVHRPDCTLLPTGSLHPHELNCSMFYRCNELSEAKAYSCPQGTLFKGQEGQICASERDTICLPRCPQPRCGECACTTPAPCQTTTNPPLTTEEATSSTEQLESTTILVTERTTERVNVTGSPFCPTIPTCKLGDGGEILPYPPDCSKYIYCDDFGGSIISSCPPNFHYSKEHQFCLPIEDANCSPCILQSTTASSPISLPPCPLVQCTSRDVGVILPYPPDCNKYIYCISEKSYQIRSCPDDLNFSPTRKICTSSYIAQCPPCNPISGTTPHFSTTEASEVTSTTYIDTTIQEETTAEITTTQEPPTTLPICDPIQPCLFLIGLPQKKPYPPDCTKYTYCFDREEPYIGSCQAGLHFSPTALDCLPPEEADCPLCVEKHNIFNKYLY